jgi:hypothetical protein
MTRLELTAESVALAPWGRLRFKTMRKRNAPPTVWKTTIRSFNDVKRL